MGEESDTAGDGGHCSHFQLYLGAMDDVGADTTAVRRYVELLESGGAQAPSLSSPSYLLSAIELEVQD